MNKNLIIICFSLVAIIVSFAAYSSQDGKSDNKIENDPKEASLRQSLTPLQYAVTQEDATETPYQNEYWDNYEEGIYVDVVSGEPLFSSNDKYDSSTGWPSFTRPIEESFVVYHEDKTLGITRNEVRSRIADSHLGHLFDDGPIEKGGRRFCINSASLRFVAREDLIKEGYAKYETIFINN